MDTLKKLARNDDKIQLILGFLHYHGINMPKDKPFARVLFEKAAIKGNAIGNYFLYWKETSDSGGDKYLLEALKRGHPTSFFELKGKYLQQRIFANEDQRYFLTEYMSAMLGSTEGKYELGLSYKEGLGDFLTIDYDKSANLLI